MNLVRCNNHERNIVPCVLTAEPTIQAGFTYAGVFVVGNRGIKAEQLVVKLASDFMFMVQWDTIVLNWSINLKNSRKLSPHPSMLSQPAECG
jgi:hypothetical protein